MTERGKLNVWKTKIKGLFTRTERVRTERSPVRRTVHTPVNADTNPNVDSKNPEHAHTERPPWYVRTGQKALLTVSGVLLTAVIIAPISLSAQSIMNWAASPYGLGLNGPWPAVVFGSLDASAAICVLFTIYCVWRGESPGFFRIMVWVFAGLSGFSNYKEGKSPDSPGDSTWWFMPLMSLLGPFLLELVLMRTGKWIKQKKGNRVRPSASMGDFGWSRWVPGVGAFRETFCSWRLAKIANIQSPSISIAMYRELCPNGEWRIMDAWTRADLVNVQSERPVRTATVQPVNVQAEPVQRTVDASERRTAQVLSIVRTPVDDSERIERVRSEWPDETPSPYKIRMLLGARQNVGERIHVQLCSDGSCEHCEKIHRKNEETA